MDGGALFAARDHNRCQLAKGLFDRHARPLGDHFPLVVVRGKPGRLADQLAQHVGIEHRQALAGVEDEWDAGGVELLRVLDHPVPAIGRDDAQSHVCGVAHFVAMGEAHRARMERVDLVVVQVRHDEGLSGERAIHRRHVAAVDAALVHPRGVRAEVLADRTHRQRISAEQLQAIGDVAGAAAKLPTHRRHHEGHVEHVDLVREDVVLEAILEDHDAVVGERAAYEGPQFSLLQRRARRKSEAGRRPSIDSRHPRRLPLVASRYPTLGRHRLTCGRPPGGQRTSPGDRRRPG